MYPSDPFPPVDSASKNPIQLCANQSVDEVSALSLQSLSEMSLAGNQTSVHDPLGKIPDPNHSMVASPCNILIKM